MINSSFTILGIQFSFPVSDVVKNAKLLPHYNDPEGGIL